MNQMSQIPARDLREAVPKEFPAIDFTSDHPLTYASSVAGVGSLLMAGVERFADWNSTEVRTSLATAGLFCVAGIAGYVRSRVHRTSW